jgi:uroporphyrinogen decarboxylase
MNKREVVIEALNFRPVPYTPWAWTATQRCAERLRGHLGCDDLAPFIDSHFADAGAAIGRFERIDEDHYRDVYGVVWDRSVDRDIGNPVDWPFRDPRDFDRYEWPDATDPAWYADVPALRARNRDVFFTYSIGFALFERAWTMRGMTDLLIDMIERPEFVEKLLDRIVEHDLVQVRKALTFDVDAIYFGDDYGMQRGLIMGLPHWRHFIRPRLARLFAPVREAGKFVIMHSCGQVDSLFDDLVEIGLNVFNPFQPEVMDTARLMAKYRGRLAFHGGMSVQKVLPFGTPDEVGCETARLVKMGLAGGYVFSPSHAVPADVRPENLVAMREVLTAQPGYRDGWDKASV